MNRFLPSLSVLLFFYLSISAVRAQVAIWDKFEKQFQSSKSYDNVLYDLRSFQVRFESPTGRVKTVSGFWDGERQWKVRFSPDEVGAWKYTSVCSDSLNTGLHRVAGSFECTQPSQPHAIYQKGNIIHPKGSYYLAHADGSPFFFTACTAWNGTLKSTDAEWEAYLTDRERNHYNVIQFTATQWRGGDKNSEGQVAFEGSGRITINPKYFQHLDRKIDAINRHGLVAAPVLLWALPVAEGRELSPGYFLPEAEATMLANYMVARYGGNHVIWVLGGDGKYVGEYEQRWKTIGRGVFGKEHPGTVALHSQGRSWIGKEYASEEWLDIVGYQTGHDNSPETARWITDGPVAREWSQVTPKVLINMEPCYEDISPAIKDKEVRNASYWSIFATPVAGISYGANGIWPWLRPGEDILNHGKSDFLRTWDASVKLPGSIQVGVLNQIFSKYAWSELKPAPELLVNAQGKPGQHISIAATPDRKLVMLYAPSKSALKVRHGLHASYTATWIDPVTGTTTAAKTTITNGTLQATPPKEGDWLLVLEGK